MSRRPERVAPGYVRAAGLLVLMAGILLMHVFVVAHAATHPAGHHAAQAISDSAPTHPTTAEPAPMPMTQPHHSTAAPRNTPMAPASAAASPISDQQAPVPTAATSTVRNARSDRAATVPTSMITAAAVAPITTVGDRLQSVAATVTALLVPGGHAQIGVGCAGNCCTMHGGLHACVFILTALALVLGPALLGRIDDDTHALARIGRGWTTRRARPPPRTMLSLAELSILRI